MDSAARFSGPLGSSAPPPPPSAGYGGLAAVAAAACAADRVSLRWPRHRRRRRRRQLGCGARRGRDRRRVDRRRPGVGAMYWWNGTPARARGRTRRACPARRRPSRWVSQVRVSTHQVAADALRWTRRATGARRGLGRPAGGSILARLTASCRSGSTPTCCGRGCGRRPRATRRGRRPGVGPDDADGGAARGGRRVGGASRWWARSSTACSSCRSSSPSSANDDRRHRRRPVRRRRPRLARVDLRLRGVAVVSSS